MPRFAFGVTLTPEERALVGAGGSGRGSTVVRAHSCPVTLPDQTTCTVRYTRYNARSHKFDFLAPLHQRIWIDPHLDGSLAAVEQTAQRVAADAFAQAQAAEQEHMRRKTPPVGSPRPDRRDPLCLSCRVADEFAGQYAVCLKSGPDRLMRIGEHAPDPSVVASALTSGAYARYTLSGDREIVVGICNRAIRRWQEPLFLADRPRLTATKGETKSPRRSRRSSGTKEAANACSSQ